MQVQFIKQRVLVFLFIGVLSFLSAVGQHHSAFADSDITVFSKSNVFCKNNQANHECVVDVMLDGPSESESEKRCKTDSSQWDFCGALLYLCHLLI